MHKELYDIPNFENWRVIEKINKGWSDDSKFYIEDYCGNKLLLRISDISEFYNKSKEFEFIKKCNKLNFSMSHAIEIGICNNENNIYMLLTWVEGSSLVDVLRNFTNQEQYALGLQSGKILNEIHSIKYEDTNGCIAENKKIKILTNIARYEDNINRIEKDQLGIDFIKNNIEKINLLAPVYKHGDYHVGNLVLTTSDTIGVIDFNSMG